MIDDLYADLVGQERAVGALRAWASRPVHAYLLLGPPGTGKRAAAVSFGASLLCPTGGVHDGGLCGSCVRALSGVHPDLVHIEREGASIGIDAAREVTRLAFLSPVEGRRKAVVLHDFHLVRDTGPALLKTIEEPPPSTVFVVLAEHVPPDLRTIASRCVTIELHPLTEQQVAEALASEGMEAGRAAALAAAAGGRLDRARLLAGDAGFEARRRAWHDAPARLDGTGATAAAVASELLALLDSSVAPLQVRHSTEMAALVERSEIRTGGRGRAGRPAAGVKDLEERHRRELRRHRTDELRSGLATLATSYRERLAVAPDRRRRAEAVEGVRHVDRAARSLEFNPNETLMLEALLARLGRIGVSAPLPLARAVGAED